MRQRAAKLEPIFAGLGMLTGSLVTPVRRQLVDDTAWYRSVSFNEFRRVVGVDQCIYSVHTLGSDGMFSLIDLHRALGERAFSPREQGLLHLFHEEVGRLIVRRRVREMKRNSRARPTIRSRPREFAVRDGQRLEDEEDFRVSGRPKSRGQFAKIGRTKETRGC